jgi:hypothetical protein
LKDKEENENFYKLLSIGLALTVGIFNSMQTLHTKFIVRKPVKQEYGVMNISADAGLIYGIVA